MHELRLPAAALVVLLALPAHAQSDVLCTSLDKLMASAAGSSPFERLGAEFTSAQAVTTINDRLPGIEAETCVARMPASAKRFGAAEGEFWEFNCTLYSDSTVNNPDARAEAQLYRDNMVKRVKVCLVKKGWVPEPPTTSRPPPPYGELHLINVSNGLKLPFELIVSSTFINIDRREQLHTVSFSFRLNGGPKPPEPLPDGVALRGRDQP
jgi:hypothetical protein